MVDLGNGAQAQGNINESVSDTSVEAAERELLSALKTSGKVGATFEWPGEEKEEEERDRSQNNSKSAAKGRSMYVILGKANTENDVTFYALSLDSRSRYTFSGPETEAIARDYLESLRKEATDRDVSKEFKETIGIGPERRREDLTPDAIKMARLGVSLPELEDILMSIALHLSNLKTMHKRLDEYIREYRRYFPTSVVTRLKDFEFRVDYKKGKGFDKLNARPDVAPHCAAVCGEGAKVINKSQIEELTNKVKELEAVIARLTGEIGGKDEEIKQKDREMAKKDEEIKEAKEKEIALEMLIKETKEDNKKLSCEVAKNVDDAEKGKAAVARLIEEANAKIEEVGQKDNEIREKEAAIARLTEETKAKAEEIRRLNERLEECEVRVGNVNGENDVYKAEIDQKGREVEEREAKIAILNKEMDENKKKMDETIKRLAGELAEYEKKIEDANKAHTEEVTKKNDEIRQMSARLTECEARAAAAVAQYEERVKELERTKRKLMNDVEEKNKAISSLYATNAEISCKANKELEDYRKWYQENLSSYTSMQNEAGRLGQQLVAEQSEKKKLQSEAGRLSQQLAAEQSEKKKLQSEAGRLSQQLTAEQSEKKKLHSEAGRLSQQLVAEQSEKRKLQSDVDGLTGKIYELQTQLDVLKAKQCEDKKTAGQLISVVSQLDLLSMYLLSKQEQKK